MPRSNETPSEIRELGLQACASAPPAEATRRVNRKLGALLEGSLCVKCAAHGGRIYRANRADVPIDGCVKICRVWWAGKLLWREFERVKFGEPRRRLLVVPVRRKRGGCFEDLTN